MSKNIIQPKKKTVETTTNIEDLIIQKMEQKAAAETVDVVENEEIDPQRVNFMMPRYLYDMMKDKLRKRGDKMSNYLIGLVRKDLGDE
jgi:hypothetical protein